MEKDKKVVIILLILCLCIIIGIFAYINRNAEMLKRAKSMTDLGINGRTADDQLLLSGIGTFSDKYTGKLTTTEIREKIEKLTKESIPNLYNEIVDLDASGLKKYYENNYENIKEKFGQTDFEAFNKFAEKLQNISVDINSWYSVVIKTDTFVSEVDENHSYAYVEYKVIFENKDELSFSMYIANEINLIPTFIIDIK